MLFIRFPHFQHYHVTNYSKIFFHFDLIMVSCLQSVREQNSYACSSHFFSYMWDAHFIYKHTNSMKMEDVRSLESDGTISEERRYKESNGGWPWPNYIMFLNKSFIMKLNTSYTKCMFTIKNH